MENKSKFVSLKRILTILAILTLSATGLKAQDNGSAIQDGPGKMINLYPNPARTYVTFDIQKNFQKGLTISIYNFLGKKMSETANVTEKTTVNLTDYNRGLYIYHLKDQSGKVIDTGKFQVSQ